MVIKKEFKGVSFILLLQKSHQVVIPYILLREMVNLYINIKQTLCQHAKLLLCA